MQAVLVQNKHVRFEPEYAPQVRENCIAVDVLQAGVCETDLQLIRGYMDFNGVLGHEFVGVARSGKFAGQRVVGEINCACHNCETCQNGFPTHCPHRTVVGILGHDGAFADTVWVPEENLHAIPDTITNDQAVFVEPLAAAFQIPEQVRLEDFRRVTILGDGRLGNLCAQVLAIHGPAPIVVGKHPAKLQRLERLAIETMLLDQLDGSRRGDLIVDCTGSPSGLTTACQLCTPRGTIVLKSTYAGETGPNPAAVVIDELTVVGSRCGPFPQAIEALKRKDVHVDDLITARFPLEQAERALELAQQKDQLKVLLEVQ